MKKIIIINCILLVFVANIAAQTKPKKPATNQGTPSGGDIEKMMKAQGLGAEEVKMMKEMLKQQGENPKAQQQGAMQEILAAAQFIPAKNTAKINSLKATYTKQELQTQTNTLFAKLTTKGNATEIAVAKKLMAELKTLTELLNASAVALNTGNLHTALLLALKALQLNPDNVVAQNNAAALLTQCGYPEKALPYITELLKQDPGNSTLLNNAAFAWLGLGDENKAYRFAYRALQANPSHPQASSCASVILDKKGMKQQAEQLMKTASSTNFTASMQNLRSNYKGLEQTGDMNWNELSKKITIYEFIKPEDKKINWPAPENVVNERDLPTIQQIAQSEDAMRKSFVKKIEMLLKGYEKEMEREMGDEKKAMSAIMKNAGKSNPGIITVSSRVAVAIIQSMMKFQNEHNLQYLQEILLENKDMENKIEMQLKTRNGESGDEMCDRIGNRLVSEAMASRNQWILLYLKDYEEEMRVRTNALLTWSAIKNTATNMPDYLDKQDLIGIALNYLGVSSIQNFGTLSSSTGFPLFKLRCKNYETLPKLKYEEPLLPKFDCPIVYSIPSGFCNMGNLESLSNNDFNIPAKPNNNFIQSSTSYSVAGKNISEAGKSSYITTDNTSTDISIGIDDEVVPLAPSPRHTATSDAEDVVPLAPSPKTVTGNDEDVVPLAPSQKTRDAQAAAERFATRKLLDEYSQQTCTPQNPTKADRNKAWREKLGKLAQEIDQWEQKELDKAKNNKSKDEDVVPLAPTKNPEDIKKYFNDVRSSVKEAETNGGLTPTIANGLSVVGKTTGFVKGMFD